MYSTLKKIHVWKLKNYQVSHYVLHQVLMIRLKKKFILLKMYHKVLVSCTQLYTNDQLTLHNASPSLDFSSDFSKNEITKKANQNDNSNSDEIIQLPQKITK